MPMNVLRSTPCRVVALVGTMMALAPGASQAATPKPTPPAAKPAAPVAKVADPAGDVSAPTDRTLVVTLPDGVIVTLEPGSHGRWLPRGKLPSETNSWAIGYHLVLLDGELDVRMPDAPKGSHAFLVQSKAGTLTDWRGKLHVMVHEDKATAAIYEGALVVGSNGMGFPVYDGAGIVMKKGVNPDKSKGIPPAPAWDSARGAPSLLLEPQGSHGNLGVAWKPVPGAASYRVAVAQDAAMSGVMEIATTNDTTYAMVERGGGGGYFAAVRAVGPEGIVGEWSAPRSLRVVHYTVPPNAVVARDGAIVLAPHTEVVLSDATGLQMAYATTTAPSTVPLYWSPLAPKLHLPEEEPLRVVHLRDPAVGQETSITLAHRSLRVDIDVTPRDPPPGVPIDVRAVAWDPTKRLDPNQEAVTLEATLDLAPMAIPWRQQGAIWTARLTPPPTFKPSVIRIVARDSFGAEIGRGFVEIAGPTQ
jgi:hypothetical protein